MAANTAAIIAAAVQCGRSVPVKRSHSRLMRTAAAAVREARAKPSTHTTPSTRGASTTAEITRTPSVERLALSCGCAITPVAAVKFADRVFQVLLGEVGP